MNPKRKRVNTNQMVVAESIKAQPVTVQNWVSKFRKECIENGNEEHKE